MTMPHSSLRELETYPRRDLGFYAQMLDKIFRSENPLEELSRFHPPIIDQMYVNKNLLSTRITFKGQLPVEVSPIEGLPAKYSPLHYQWLASARIVINLQIILRILSVIGNDCSTLLRNLSHLFKLQFQLNPPLDVTFRTVQKQVDDMRRIAFQRYIYCQKSLRQVLRELNWPILLPQQLIPQPFRLTVTHKGSNTIFAISIITVGEEISLTKEQGNQTLVNSRDVGVGNEMTLTKLKKQKEPSPEEVQRVITILETELKQPSTPDPLRNVKTPELLMETLKVNDEYFSCSEKPMEVGKKRRKSKNRRMNKFKCASRSESSSSDDEISVIATIKHDDESGSEKRVQVKQEIVAGPSEFNSVTEEYQKSVFGELQGKEEKVALSEDELSIGNQQETSGDLIVLSECGE